MEGETKIDFGANGPILEVTIEDVDELTSADFMGELNIPLEPLKKQRTRAWHPLQADAEGKHKSSNVCGEVELVLYWTYNEALDFDPFLEEDAFPEKPSNELRIGLAQGRNLAIKDKDLFGSGGSSDPRVIFTVDGTELKATSTCKKKTLNPRWKEIFVLPYTRGPEDSQPPFLTVTCEDVDELTSADFMGRVQIELDPLLDHKRSRAWHALQAKSDAKTSSNIAGDLDIVLQWHYNPAHDFDPFPDDELGAEKDALYADKAPNELRLALVQGRGLAIKDKNLLSKGGSSDPFVKFEVTGGDYAAKPFKSSIKKKTLQPVWREIFQVPLKQDAEQDNPVVDVTVYDHDEVSSPDFMGRCAINVEELKATKKAARVWHALLPEEGKSDNVTGDVEIIAQWWYNPALDFDPFLEPDDHPDEAPNELRVALVAGRDLAIKDKNLLSKGGTSDPRATFKVSGTELECQSTTKEKSLNPRWCEVFAMPYTPGSEHENPPFLDVILEDVDAMSAADFMGRVKVELTPLKDHKRLRKWFPLQADAEDTKSKASSNVTGELELIVQWRFNKELQFAPFDDVPDEPIPAGKTPNELRVALVQARRLAIKDKPLLGTGGSSDPVARFEIGDLKFESTVLRKTLNPVWQQAFAKPLSASDAGEAPSLTVVMEDWDELTSRDFMGQCAVDLGPWLADPSTKPLRSWYLLDLSDGKKTHNVSGEVELIVQWRWNPSLDFEPFKDSDGTPGKAPNALRIGLGSGRDLAVKDKALLYGEGSSDPRCVFDIVYAAETTASTKVKSATQKKTLNPSWREVLELEVDDASASLRCVCEDVDELTSADFMGEFLVPLADLPDQKVTKKWYALGKSDKHKSDNISGDVELVLQWYYDEKLDFDAFPDVDDSGKPPNELCVGVFKARNLAIKDKNLVTKNSSDPFVELSVAGTTVTRKTKVKKQTLDPVWKEQFTLPFSAERPEGSPPPELVVTCLDWDEISAPDHMGEARVPLGDWVAKPSRRGEKMWLPLVPAEGKSENVAGEVCVVVCWRYDPARDFSPFDDDDEAEHAGKEPNELRIGLFQATGLAIKDKNLLSKGGSSDPRVTFTVPGTHLKAVSACKKKTLDPVWKEVLVLPLPRGPTPEPPRLVGHCEDVDEVTSADSMGEFSVDLGPLQDRKVRRIWGKLAKGEKDKSDNISGDVELVLQWRYNPRLDFDPRFFRVFSRLRRAETTRDGARKRHEPS